ncbi:LANO_0C06326g1_1 [Lachancea nothofagi CBS 11611]|uniref:LANO_0C06326g1_1 n=1 Tax=Lachancea nothofagi CBS 11611 TaxID=1266666 RepID=A0A1G4J7S9_9SACH|nr:LANO_0C06326g1_1 [Lachancea nothofagi CBS 11611]
MENEFKKVPLTSNQDFSWVFLIDWILILSVSILAAFYFGRTFGFTITTLLEWLVWKRFSVKVQVQSLKISFLGGRIFFKNLTIVTQNQTVSFLQGSLTWRYWLLNSKQTAYAREQCRATGKDPHKCRFKLECQGFEHFIYNKTQAFDHLWNSLSKSEQARFKHFEEFSEDDQKSSHNETSSFNSSSPSTGGHSDHYFESSHSTSSPLPSFLRILPLEIAVHKGALIVGNRNTSSIMISSYDTLDGIFDVAMPSSKLDLYKTQIQCELKMFRITLEPNLAFKAGAPLKNLVKYDKLTKVWHKSLEILLKAKSGHFHDLYRTDSSSSPNLQNPLEEWKGLGLYRKEDDAAWDDTFKFNVSKHRYAKYSKIMKCEKFTLNYSFDSPGIVTHGSSGASTQTGKSTLIDTEPPPDFSIDVQLFGATIHYGPWSHHEIFPLQKIFSPTVSKDSQPSNIPKEGMLRSFTRARLSITIMSSSILRIPTREPSKDLEFLKHYRESQDDTRPFGWLEILLAQGSEIRFDFAMTPTSSGFDNILDLHLVNPELRTSVNHDILFNANTHDIHAQIGYPLGWNQRATWVFDLTSSQAQFFILKDHVTLMGDLIGDFGSGEPTTYDLFRPFIYKFNWVLTGYSIYLNVNDANIVNNPVDFNENCYLSFHGDELRTKFTVPQLTVAGNSTAIDYELFTPMFRLRINTPSWNTLHEFMKDQEVGRSHDFKMSGSYLFYSKLDVDNIDTIIINCQSRMTTLKCYGFVLRYLIGVKMNYFGDFVHFKTTEEYMEELRGINVGKKTVSAAVEDFLHILNPPLSSEECEGSNPFKHDGSLIRKSSLKRMVNEKDVWFTFVVEDGCIVLPENLYDCETCFTFDFDSLEVDARHLNYYMDLQSSMSPINIKRLQNCDPEVVFNHDRGLKSKDEPWGFISDLHIHAHRLFGLPPDEETYFCKWDFALSSLDLCSDLSFTQRLLGSCKKLGFGFKDYENIMNYTSTDVLDMTSVTFAADEVTSRIVDKNTGFIIVTKAEKIKATFADLENSLYSSRADIDIPILSITILEEASKQQVVGVLKTSIKITQLSQLEDFLSHTQQQKAHIAANDAPFHRCPFLLPRAIQQSSPYNDLLGCIPPGVSIPSVVKPLNDENYHQVIDEFLKGETSFKSDSRRRTSQSIANLPVKGSRKPSSIPLLSDTKNGSNAKVLDPSFDCEGLIMNIKEVSLQLDPRCHPLLGSLLGQVYSNSVDQLIDNSEIDVVLEFIQNTLGGKHYKTFKIVSPNIELSIGDLFDAQNYSQRVESSIRGLNIDISLKQKRGEGVSQEDNDPESVQEVTGLLRISSLKLDVMENRMSVRKRQSDFLFSFLTKEVEAWISSTDTTTASVNAETIDSTINPDTFDQFCKFLQILIVEFGRLNSLESHFSALNINARRELFYQIAAASDEYQITHDPPVITKPAYITRLPNQHVRENRSWKIITRLRHIMNYLPKSLVSDLYESIKKSNFKAPDTAGETFLKIFSKWRSWEFSDVEKCFFYRQAFAHKVQDEEGCGMVNLRADVGLFSFTISRSIDEDGDNAIFKNIKLCQFYGGASLPDDEGRRTEGLGNINEKQLSCSIKVAKVSIGDITLKLLDAKNLFPLIVNDSEGLAATEELRLMFQQINVLIDRCEVQLVSGTKKASLKSFGNIATLALTNHASTKYSATLLWSWGELGVRHRNSILFEMFSRGGSIGTLHSPDHESHSTVIGVRSQKLRVKLPSASASYCTFVKSVMVLQESLNSKFQRLRQSLAAERKGGTSKHLTSQYFARFDIADVSCDISAISPFLVSTRVRNFTLNLEQGSETKIYLGYEGLDLTVGQSQAAQQYVKFSQYMKFSQSRLGITYSKSNHLLNTVHSLIIDSDLSKFKISDPKSIASELQKDLNVAKLSFDSLQESFKTFQSKSDKVRNQKTAATAPFFTGKWNFCLKAKYFGLLIPFESTKYILEFNEMMLAGSSKRINLEKNAYFGENLECELSVSSVGFLVNDAMLSEELSKLLDFGINVKIAQECKDVVKSLEFKSSHLRVALCPVSLIKLLILANEIASLTSIHYHAEEPKELQTEDSGILMEVFKALRAIQSIHILSYNFCLGWLFDVEGTTNPGLIWGYQRLFAAHEWPYGKLTLFDAYFSIARGFSAADFYSTDSELNKLNRSFLPSTQIGYWFEGADSSDNLSIRINGERLDVSFLSKSIDVADGLVKSIHAFGEMKSKQLDPFRSSSVEKVPGSSKTSRNPVFSGIRTVNCKARYAGGVIKLYSSKNINLGENPSFQLESPSVEVIVDYKHLLNGDRRHVVRALINVDESHNTIFPTCVPILGELARDIRQLMKSFNSDSTPVTSMSSVQENINYKSLLKDFDISFQTHFDPQLVSLSCEPKAKVQADVGFDKLVIKMFTNNIDALEPLSLSIEMQNVTATSRHIFSREVSTSLKIDHPKFVFVLTHPETIHTYGIVHIPNIDVYFNIKQLQDLNVFLNIWKVDSKVLFQPESENNVVDTPIKDRSLAAKHKKVSSNSSFPWNFVMIITKINGDIDLGVSLGVLSLSTDRIWAVTDHYSNWTQKLCLQLEKLSLSSDGRLGGTLLLRNFSWMSQISWPVHKGELQNPLIILDVALAEFALKLSFDYHLILIASIELFKIKLFNKRDPAGLLKNLLSVLLFCDKTHISITALAPANVLDVYNTIKRMRKDNKKSYLETLGDSNTKDTKYTSTGREILNSLSFLRTELEVKLNFIHTQVFPSTLFDKEVLTFKATNLLTRSQIEGDEKLKTHLNWQIHDVKIALSTFKTQLQEKVASQIGVREYTEHASKAHGGTILVIPAILIGMTTWHDVTTNTVEFIFSNSFGGNISVRWNLGSINFLREMWATHVRALALRRSSDQQPKSLFEDEHLEDKLKDVDLGDKYTYVPLEEPLINIPQTKDLGEATPPVEWFGVNRRRFPGMTHQAIIVPLQKLAHLAETEWALIFGSA